MYVFLHFSLVDGASELKGRSFGDRHFIFVQGLHRLKHLTKLSTVQKSTFFSEMINYRSTLISIADTSVLSSSEIHMS